MLSAQRRLKIAEIASKNSGIKTSDLSHMFDVSEMTILRDLNVLEEQGILKRVYGGAVAIKDSIKDIPINFREKINVKEKNTISINALDLISDGDSILLDGSSTSLALAKNLATKKGITLITNGLNIINEVKDYRNIDIISLGGEYDPITMNFIGPTTVSMLDNYNADKAFISSAGISLDAGVTVATSLQALVKKAMLASSKQSVLLVDNTKFGKITLNKVCDIKDLDIIITDRKPDGAYIKDFKESSKINLIY